MDKLYPEQARRIEQIIDTSRHHEERFLTDSKSASKDILNYLRDEGMIEGYAIPKKEVEVVLEYY